MKKKWLITFVLTALLASAINIVIGFLLLKVEAKEAVFVGLFAGIGTAIVVAYGLSYNQKNS